MKVYYFSNPEFFIHKNPLNFKNSQMPYVKDATQDSDIISFPIGCDDIPENNLKGYWTSDGIEPRSSKPFTPDPAIDVFYAYSKSRSSGFYRPYKTKKECSHYADTSQPNVFYPDAKVQFGQLVLAHHPEKEAIQRYSDFIYNLADPKDKEVSSYAGLFNDGFNITLNVAIIVCDNCTKYELAKTAKDIGMYSGAIFMEGPQALDWKTNASGINSVTEHKKLQKGQVNMTIVSNCDY
jgi:hypothetical protein